MMKNEIDKDFDNAIAKLKESFDASAKKYERINGAALENLAYSLLDTINPHIKNSPASKAYIKYWLMVTFYNIVTKAKRGGFYINEKET